MNGPAYKITYHPGHGWCVFDANARSVAKPAPVLFAARPGDLGLDMCHAWIEAMEHGPVRVALRIERHAKAGVWRVFDPAKGWYDTPSCSARTKAGAQDCARILKNPPAAVEPGVLGWVGVSGVW